MASLLRITGASDDAAAALDVTVADARQLKALAAGLQPALAPDRALADQVRAAIDAGRFDPVPGLLHRMAEAGPQALAVAGGVALVQRRYAEAATLFQQAAFAAPEQERQPYLELQATALFRLGSPASLHQAAGLLRGMLGDLPPDRWAAVQDSLGTVLLRLADDDSLALAITAFRAAAQARAVLHQPLDWAASEVHLADALVAQAAQRAGTALLEEAEADYRAALAERRRDLVPLDWAATQDRIGNALSLLAERETKPLDLLEATKAYELALLERRRDLVPFEWASTENNLGNALTRYGEQQDDAASIDQAIAAYRAALGEFTRERAPDRWAAVQSNLGAALVDAAMHGGDTDRLREAVVAYRAAASARPRDQAPTDWAIIQFNLGLALLQLGLREDGTASLGAAAKAFDDCLSVVGLLWPQERVQVIIGRRDTALAEIARREAVQ